MGSGDETRDETNALYIYAHSEGGGLQLGKSVLCIYDQTYLIEE